MTNRFNLAGISGTLIIFGCLLSNAHGRASDRSQCYADSRQTNRDADRLLRDENERCRLVDDGLLSDRFQACHTSAYERRREQRQEASQRLQECLSEANLAEERAERREREERAEGKSSSVTGSTARLLSKPERVIAGVAAVSLIIDALFTKRVEKAYGKGAPNEASKLAAENNKRAAIAFRALQNGLVLNPVVRAFQTQTFGRLDNQVTSILEQLSNIQATIDATIASVPTQQQVMSAPGRRMLGAALTYGNEKFDYEGQTDETGRPHGLGIAKGTGESRPSVYVGSFASGHMAGSGRFIRDYGSLTTETEARLENGESKGVAAIVHRSRQTGMVLTLTRTNDQRQGIMEQRNSNGSIYRGQHKGLWAEGYGEYQDGKGKIVRGFFKDGQLTDGPRIIIYDSELRTTIMCEYQADKCSGPRRLENADGTFSVGTMSADEFVGDAVTNFKTPDGWRVYEGGRPSANGKHLGRLSFEEGHVYEGEFAGNEWGNDTIGRYRVSDGTVLEGRFLKNDLTDGLITYPDGLVEKRGNGTRFTIPSYVAKR